MITHILPTSGSSGSAAGSGPGAGSEEICRLKRPGPWGSPFGEGRDGPVRVPLHAPPRCQGARFGAGFISRSARPRWLRWRLLLSGARSPGTRCRRQRLARGDRGAGRWPVALFRAARALFAGALWHERDAEGRRRRPRGDHRRAQDACRDRGRRRLRRSRPQISDLGARPLSRGTRGGHREVRAYKQELGARMAGAKPLGARE